MTKKKILLYQGGRYFSLEKTHQHFENILEEYRVDMYDSVDIFSNKDFFDCSVIIFFSQEGEFSEEQEKNVLEFVASGKGFIGLHGASASFKNHPKYFEMLGGKFISHKNIINFEIKIINKNHPITRNLDNFSFKDEPYRHEFSMVNEIHVLAEADYHDIKDPKPEPIMWVREYGKGRVFFCALGHRTTALKDPLFQKIIRSAVMWVLQN